MSNEQNSLGARLRKMRQSAGMTQEQLSERLCVSSQVISKWENNLTAPDISLLPILASIFSTSIEELLGFNGKEQEKEIESIAHKAYGYRKKADFLSASNILREGLIRFPNDEVLLNCLLYCLDDRKERINIATSLCEGAVKPEVKYDALRFLAEDYSEEKNYPMVRFAIEKIPEIYFTKLEIGAKTLTGEEKKKYAFQEMAISLESLIDMIVEYVKYLNESNKNQEASKYLSIGTSILNYFKGIFSEEFVKELEDRII